MSRLIINPNKDKKVSAVEIFATGLKTKEGLHVGSTAGDMLKAFPDATVRSSNSFLEYTDINDIIYVYNQRTIDGDRVGNYPNIFDGGNVQISPIINKNTKICGIIIGNINMKVLLW